MLHSESLESSFIFTLYRKEYKNEYKHGQEYLLQFHKWNQEGEHVIHTNRASFGRKKNNCLKIIVIYIDYLLFSGQSYQIERGEYVHTWQWNTRNKYVSLTIEESNSADGNT